MLAFIGFSTWKDIGLWAGPIRTGGGGAIGLAYCLGDYALWIAEQQRQQQQQCVQRRMLHLWLINVPAIWDDDDDDNVDDHDDEEDDDDDEHDDVDDYEQLFGGANGR